MRYKSLLLPPLSFLLYAAAYSSTSMSDLEGVWTTEDSRFYKNGVILKGVAVYLRQDGLGAIGAGYPPLAYMIRTAPIIDGEPFACVQLSPERFMPCLVKLRLRNGTLELGEGKSAQWTRLTRKSASIPKGVNQEFGWPNSSPIDKSRAKRSIPIAVDKLLSLPDFADAIGRVKTREALTVLSTTYWNYVSNKAFAVSEEGYYGYSASGMDDENEARQMALSFCDSFRQKDSSKRPCRIVNVNGKWVD